MTGQEHYAAAERLLARAGEIEKGIEEDDSVPLALDPAADDRWHDVSRAVTRAQVHATLALVEQQRIANLISIWTLPDATKMRMVVAGGIDPTESDRTAAQIMAGLGMS